MEVLTSLHTPSGRSQLLPSQYVCGLPTRWYPEWQNIVKMALSCCGYTTAFSGVGISGHPGSIYELSVKVSIQVFFIQFMNSDMPY